jgi:hypothetical protein
MPRCRFRPRAVNVASSSHCKPKQEHCRRNRGAQTRSVDLTPLFHSVRFPVGTDLAVSFVKGGFVGKAYIFQMRSKETPTWRATCLAPGSLVPGRGC